jgi:cellulose synthase/poly-beta-1,6-N-acetylglucosamine synthase-like glycosyltransferase
VPRFSVVVPTRDRPDLLEYCLESLNEQTFDDIEVVVSDNPVLQPARYVFDRWARPGWRYLPADRPQAMHENFERGCATATGEYIAVMIDKTVLHPSALEITHRALLESPEVDIVTWWNELYSPVDEAHDIGRGTFVARANPATPTPYEAYEELAWRLSNEEPRGIDEIRYVRGKIVFGVYSRALLERIRATAGRVFWPIAPDYTSMAAASLLSRRALDLGRPLLLSYNSGRGNGCRQAVDPVHARRFIEESDPDVLDALPIPGLYASVHNVVAHDMVTAGSRCAPERTPPLDFPNLLRRVREDLERYTWPDPDERARQFAILESTERRYGVVPAPAGPRKAPSAPSVISRLRTVIAPRRRIRRLRSRPTFASGTYTSPLEAARAADRYYAGVAGAR